MDPDAYAAKATSEHGHQVALFMWASQHRNPQLKLMFAIPNGGERNKIVAARLKAEGVKPGVPDVFLPVTTTYAGLFIEMKKPKQGRVAEEQTPWHINLRHQGYRVEVCYSFAEARTIICEYMGITP